MSQPIKILVVEDDAMLALLMTDMLDDLGYVAVGPSLTFDAALAAARTGEFDAAILDINLGGQSSYPLAQAVRDRGLPLVFASGYGAGELPAPFDEAPILQKPYTLATLEAALSSILAPEQ